LLDSLPPAIYNLPTERSKNRNTNYNYLHTMQSEKYFIPRANRHFTTSCNTELCNLYKSFSIVTLETSRTLQRERQGMHAEFLCRAGFTQEPFGRLKMRQEDNISLYHTGIQNFNPIL
jgi:hypothetical protein